MPDKERLFLGPWVRRNTVVITGEPGCGKTELAINLALAAVDRGQAASIVDLDVVTPLFRSRDATGALARFRNVRVIAPPGDLRGSDLPLVPGAIPAATASGFTVIDCGGGPTGARALSSVRRLLGEYEALAVINPFRPFGGAEAMGDALRYLQELGRFDLTAVISNPHLGVSTSLSDIIDGHRQVEETALRLGLPVRFACARIDLVPAVAAALSSPVFGLRLFMVTPWSEQASSGGESLDAEVGPGR